MSGNLRKNPWSEGQCKTFMDAMAVESEKRSVIKKTSDLLHEMIQLCIKFAGYNNYRHEPAAEIYLAD